MSHYDTTYIVNLFGGPGSGKSTTACLVFARLKQAGISCELATEVAKDLTWDERQKTLKCQPYISGKQIWRLERLLNKVQVVVTDSPIPLCPFYVDEGPEFRNFILAKFNKYNNMNYFIKRGNYVYQTEGRNQTLKEAIEVDVNMKLTFERWGISMTHLPCGNRAADYIVEDVLKCLQVS